MSASRQSPSGSATVSAVPGYLEKLGVNYPIYVADRESLEALFPRSDDIGVPLSLIVDEKGVAQELLSGWTATTRKRLAELTGH